MVTGYNGGGGQVGTENVVSVGTTSTQIAFVPPGHTISVQNLGAKTVTLAMNHPAVAKVGFILKGGTPGASFTQTVPDDQTSQRWYAIATTAATTISVLVV